MSSWPAGFSKEPLCSDHSSVLVLLAGFILGLLGSGIAIFLVGQRLGLFGAPPAQLAFTHQQTLARALRNFLPSSLPTRIYTPPVAFATPIQPYLWPTIGPGFSQEGGFQLCLLGCLSSTCPCCVRSVMDGWPYKHIWFVLHLPFVLSLRYPSHDRIPCSRRTTTRRRKRCEADSWPEGAKGGLVWWFAAWPYVA